MNIADRLSEINWLAVVSVTILSFILGMLWHSKLLFGKAWKEDTGFDPSKKINFTLTFGLSAIFNFTAMLGLAAFIGAHTTCMHGLYKGFIVSIIWVSTSIGATYLFANRPLRLLLIDAGYYVVLFSIAGMLLAVW